MTGAEKNTTSTKSALHVRPGVERDVNRRFIPRKRRSLPPVEEIANGIKARDVGALSQGLTLVESKAAKHRPLAEELIRQLAGSAGSSMRLGITGVPGVGKSTLIDVLGMMIVEDGKRVAVLAVDPSSEMTGGSILGDKTRMESLSLNENAYVRPTASGDWMGGVARGTRAGILLCEAAGYDLVIVETVGVGQSETQVASMVDFFLLLMLANAGDELQGMKRGIMEVADAIAINKADGPNIEAAEVARGRYQAALRLMRPPIVGWSPEVMTCSATTKAGLETVWTSIKRHREHLEQSNQLEKKRAEQALYWMKQQIDYLLKSRFYENSTVKEGMESIEDQVVRGVLSPFAAADQLIELSIKKSNKEHHYETGEGD